MPRGNAFLRILLVAGVSFCGASCGKPPIPEDPSTPSQGALIAVVLSPLGAEAQGGGQEVTISSKEGLATWLKSEAFASEGWSPNEEKTDARYRVTFRLEGGDGRSYYLGTTADSKIEYKCFGLCATWWVAPSRADGSQDPDKYRVMSDAVWHPLAREWYMGSK